MKNKLIIGIAGIFLSLLSFISCNDSESASPELSIGNIADTIPQTGGTKSLGFSCNSSWSVDTTGFSWLHVVSPISGDGGNASLQYSAEINSTGLTRSLTMTIVAANGQRRRITVVQAPNLFPSYNTSPIAADATGMTSTAMQIADKIKLGINIGNTMEIGSFEQGNPWGNPLITQLLIDSIKQAGFTAIRIPVEYDYNHVEKSTGKIDPAWLNRVKTVAQYCVNDGIYTILNIHWDGGWLDCEATGISLDSIKAKQKAYWEQIATTMRDFDEHIIFASANEPYGHSSNFTFTLPTVTNLYNYHQIFINAVRSTGGKNAYRTLVIQAPVTSGDLINYFSPSGVPGLPADNVASKLMLEFHYYGPYQFCLHTDPATDFYYWGLNYHSATDPAHNATYAEEPYVDATFERLKANFADKGIPLVLGEMGAFVNNGPTGGALTGDNLALSKASRGHWYSYICRSALKNGALPFIWDTGELFNRNTGAVQNRQLMDSLRYAATH
jgi:endoglucanase